MSIVEALLDIVGDIVVGTARRLSPSRRKSRRGKRGSARGLCEAS